MNAKTGAVGYRTGVTWQALEMRALAISEAALGRTTRRAIRLAYLVTTLHDPGRAAGAQPWSARQILGYRAVTDSFLPPST